MEKTVFNKKQYFILLSLSAAVSLLIPLLCDIVFSASSTAILSAVSLVEVILSCVGSAIIVFVALRYRFRLCLPFAAVIVLKSLISFIKMFVEDSGNGVKIYPIVFIDALMACVVPFVIIGIAKLINKHLKKELAVVLLTIAGMMVLSFIVQTAAAFGEGNTASQILKSALSIFILLLRNFLYVGTAYLFLDIVFAQSGNKPKRLKKDEEEYVKQFDYIDEN